MESRKKVYYLTRALFLHAKGLVVAEGWKGYSRDEERSLGAQLGGPC
jgi:hypothetical protein